ncbi:transcription antitermination factor NusB [Verrucomicrobiota bacterium]
MTRRNARERAVQFLFQMDFNPDDLDSALSGFWKEKKTNAKARQFAEELIRGVLEHLKSIDSKIQGYADHWDLNRMGAVDRNVIRLALYEMLFRPDIPPVVSINEAVDIAKRFSSNESGRFVNGILDRAKEDLCRPAREPASNLTENPSP